MLKVMSFTQRCQFKAVKYREIISQIYSVDILTYLLALRSNYLSRFYLRVIFIDRSRYIR